MQRLISTTAVIAVMALPFAGFAQAQTPPPTEPPATETPAPTEPPAADTPAPDAMTPAPDAMGADDPMGADVTAFDRSNYSPLTGEAVTVEQLTGTRVYDNEENGIGRISDFVVNGDTIEQVILDVGGFLGIGTKQVALPLSELEILKENDGDDIRVYSSQTKETLEALAPYEG